MNNGKKGKIVWSKLFESMPISMRRWKNLATEILIYMHGLVSPIHQSCACSCKQTKTPKETVSGFVLVLLVCKFEAIPIDLQEINSHLKQ